MLRGDGLGAQISMTHLSPHGSTKLVLYQHEEKFSSHHRTITSRSFPSGLHECSHACRTCARLALPHANHPRDLHESCCQRLEFLQAEPLKPRSTPDTATSTAHRSSCSMGQHEASRAMVGIDDCMRGSSHTCSSLGIARSKCLTNSPAEMLPSPSVSIFASSLAFFSADLQTCPCSGGVATWVHVQRGQTVACEQQRRGRGETRSHSSGPSPA